jgi:hypothetical protein
MKSLIPFSFDPSADTFEENHLEYVDKAGGKLVVWPLAGLSIFVPDYEYYPKFESIENANAGLVKFHDETGYSIGNYHEFLISELPANIGFRMGKIEVTFGEATPMMAFLFNGLHFSKYYGPWQNITTARIVGASVDEFELAFLNAATRYQVKYSVLPKIWSMNDSWIMEEAEYEGNHIVSGSAAVGDIHSIRFLYHGMSQTDDTAACIYFYRILEYYSFLASKKQMSTLRHNTTLSENEFAKRILDLITKDEKGPLLKLVNTISSLEILTQAKQLDLVKETNSNLLGEEIYVFRNSIVHGKSSYGYDLNSSSVLSESNNVPKWRIILQSLAQKAMDSFAERVI